MPDKKPKYYAYFVADGPQGVTEDWEKCERMVKGVPGARYKSFDSEKEAEAWLAAGAIYEPKKKAELQPGIYFDAGTGRGEGVEISVTDEKGTNLLKKALSRDDLNKYGKHLLENPEATNNFGELLALKYAIQIAKKEKVQNIFGDSKLVIEYWSRWRIKRKDLPEETVELANEVSKLRETFEMAGGTVARISGADNPADLGFHK